MSWSIRLCEDVPKRLKKFQKKWRHEVVNVFDNLDTLLDALSHGAKPEQLKKLGFVHTEPFGILAVDQSGPGKGSKMKELRLYVYPHQEKEDLYAMILGDKDTQSDDINLAKVFVSGLMEQSDTQHQQGSEVPTDDTEPEVDAGNGE